MLAYRHVPPCGKGLTNPAGSGAHGPSTTPQNVAAIALAWGIYNSAPASGGGGGGGGGGPRRQEG